MRPTSDLDRLLTLVGALVETLRPSHGRVPASSHLPPCLHCRLVVAYDQLTAASPAGSAVSPPPAGPAAPTPGAVPGGAAPGPASGIREVLAELRLSTSQAVQVLATAAPETFGPLGPADLLDLEGADLVLAAEILRADAGGRP